MLNLAPAWPDAPELVIDPAEEVLRVNELHALNLLDSPAEDRFDTITRLAAAFFRVPTAYIAFLDGERQWLKSRVGVEAIETPRCLSFCQYTILKAEPLVMTNALEHPIGRNHPWVLGDPKVRFYAGVPLAGPSGKKIGTFCLVDFVPREFGERDLACLTSFAALVEREINLGEIIQTQNELLQMRQQLLDAQQALQHEFADAARYVRHMIPPPFTEKELSVEWHFHPSMKLGGDGLGYRRIDDDLLALYVLDVTGHGLGSALLAVTLQELLRNPAVQIDFSKPAVVIERLNRTFPMQDHASKFFSVWYGVYSRSQRTITYANAGHPPALLLTRDQGKAELCKTEPSTSVLGVLPQITARESALAFPPGAELFLFTDGLYELLEPGGGRGSYDEFYVWLRKAVADGTRPWDAIRRWHEESHEKKRIDDDVSMLRFATK